MFVGKSVIVTQRVSTVMSEAVHWVSSECLIVAFGNRITSDSPERGDGREV